MIIHNTKIDNPKEPGAYMSIDIVSGKDVEFVSVGRALYDSQYFDGWVGTPPMAWAELPTIEEVKGALYVTDK